jgi:aspartyl-tRNA synthetase
MRADWDRIIGMERLLVSETPKKIGQKVRLCGWVNRRRDHGKLVFIDLRDRSGVVQIVGKEKLGELRISDVIEVVGRVKKRLKGTINPKLPTGKIEVGLEKIRILAKAEDLPFDIRSDGYRISEEARLKYRYLDLRRPRLIKNLELRHRVANFFRQWLTEKGFIEVETPYISKATPEGSRDFLVPSRLQPGKFYALPQAPQQYKQLLMVAGLEKYFQLARVFRDEDPRADRAYGEYTQIDIEISFISQNEIINLVESMLIELVEKVVGKKIYKKPFPRIPYSEAMKKYGADRFDLRKKKDPNILAFAWIVDFPLFEKTETREISPSHNPFTAPKDEDVHLLDKNPLKVRSWQHDLICNGYEVAGGAIRVTDPKLQAKIFEILGHRQKEIEKKFGHLLKAFKYGVPPHGGIALSLERLMMVFTDEKNTREVTAFPMTSGGQTAVMDAPSEADPGQLNELGIKIVKRK